MILKKLKKKEIKEPVEKRKIKRIEIAENNKLLKKKKERNRETKG